MPTSRIILSLDDRVDPDGTAGNIAPGGPTTVTSSGTPPSNAPKVRYRTLDFDQTTDEQTMFLVPLPGDYASGGELIIKWFADVTTGNVIWKAAVAILDVSSTDLDAAVFSTVVTSSAVAVPSTVGQFKETTVPFVMTGATAGDLLAIMVGRDADNGSDTAAGDARIPDTGLIFAYSTT